MPRPSLIVLGCLVAAAGCSSADRGLGEEGADTRAEGSAVDPTESGSGSGDEGGASGETGGEGSEGAGGLRFDAAPSVDITIDTEQGEPSCKVESQGAGVGPCTRRAPPESFDAVVEWSWDGDGEFRTTITTPIVANLDDDNGDGEVDLCDTPEIVVIAAPRSVSEPGYLYIFDGATGALEGKSNALVRHDIDPALADLDNDGVPELLAALSPSGRVGIFNADGTLRVMGDGLPTHFYEGGSFSVADLDNDGDPEIMAIGVVYDSLGKELFSTGGAARWSLDTAVDLDGDGDLEVVTGLGAFQHDGTPMWTFAVESGQSGEAYPHVANLDDDEDPEVLFTTGSGFVVVEHDGTLKYGPLRPTGVDTGRLLNWLRPGVIADFDGDGRADFGQSSRGTYATYDRDGAVRWQSEVKDWSGLASATAFDFLGDASSEAIYADEDAFIAFNDDGVREFEISRDSRTIIEYPIVADVDNDGSAEVVVPSDSVPPLQVVGDADDRWIQARRIWNQHTYHVTNIDEDGRVPQFEQPSWKLFNTFRANVQIEAGGICIPPVPG